MAISDLYSTGIHQQNIGHFATIVRLALLDDKINEKEYKLLERLSVRLDVTKKEFESILKNPDSYPVNPPVSYEDRLRRLYDLTKMLFLDRNPTIDKTSMMDRIAVGLGFPLQNVRDIVKEAIKFFLKEPDIDDFKEVIKKVNPMNN
ncbi:MAG: TerB family tellurite resistance protein [Lutibacter sp.]|nr:TerB family tellurite resistance protein [Lutibacter sp.]